ncbi:MAG: arginine biosynthesis protein ArgJ [Coriobacteriaceae bacterium]|nr:arginine biosynthesis protein ArgJ [Coriobacteriaceae bacterium]
MDMDQFDNALRPIDGGGVTSPAGFRAAALPAGIRPGSTASDLAILLVDEAAPVSAVFTKSAFDAAPVRVSRANLAAGDGTARAVVMNGVSANAATGEQGLACARETVEIAAQILGCETAQVLVASAGAIGEPLDIEPFDTTLPALIDAASPDGGPLIAQALAVPGARPRECAISYASKTLAYAGCTFTVGGLCMGEGPFALLTTDAPVCARTLGRIFEEVVGRTFAKVLVDPDRAVSGVSLMLASGAAGADAPEIAPGTEEAEELAYVVGQVAETLARQVAADGAGASKLLTVRVAGAVSDEDADAAARAVGTSSLVRAQVAGRVCEAGAVLAALGRSGAAFDQESAAVSMMGIPVCEAGVALPVDAAEAARRFEAGEIEIAIDLGAGEASTTVWGSDLTAAYVEQAARR